MNTEILEVPLGQLRESPRNARKTFDKQKLQELADSIRGNGVLTPLLVRARYYELENKAATEPELTYEILAGARRSRAAKLAGLAAVPCVVREVDDTAALEIITMENLQREDLSAIEEAQGFKALLDLGKYDVAELAKRLGKSSSYVYQRVKLVELAPEAAKALAAEKITPGHAILIARLQQSDQARALKEMTSGGNYNQGGRNVSVRELANWIKEEIHLDLTRVPWKRTDAQLVPAAGSCNDCPKRQKNDCEDPACYETKMRAHFKQIEKASDSRLVKISGEYKRPGVDILSQYEWRPAKAESCPDATIGLMMTGGYAQGRPAKRGEQLGVCVNRKCKVHWKANQDTPSSYKRPASELKKERKRREEFARRARLFKALTEKRLAPNEADTRMIVDWMARQLDQDHAKRLFDAMGWAAPPATSYGGKDYWNALRRRLKAMKIGEIEQWMLWLVVAAEDLYVKAYGTLAKSAMLDPCAKRAGATVPAVVTLQSKPKNKPAKATAKPKTKRKKAA